MKDKILVITNRNVLTTCGALRLIKNRAEVLYSDYQIATDFCVFQRSKRVASLKREKINAGGNMWITGYSILSFPFSYFSFLRRVNKTIRSNKYKAIILSHAALPINVASLKKIIDVPIFLDGHGASEDIYECVRGYSHISLFLRYLAYKIDIFLNKYYLKRIDGCFVVSNGMKDYYNSLAENKNLYYVIAPCSTVSLENLFDFDSARDEYRKKFEVDENELCFVYSGGIEPWQCVAETIDLFKKLSEQLSSPCKMFIFTYETEKVVQMINGDDRFCIMSFRANELKKALCAMDYAFLIRKNTVTNHVAFPNKFLEYIQARLKVISTSYVYDVVEQIRNYECGYIYDSDYGIIGIVSYIEKSHNNPIGKEHSQFIIESSSFKNRLKCFVDYINKL